MKIDPNDSATGFAANEYYQGNAGITVKAQIAAMCLQGLLSNTECNSLTINIAAKAAIVAADTLIKQLNETS